MFRKIVVLIPVLSAAFFLFAFTSTDRAFDIAKNTDIFSSLFQEISQSYVDDVNPNQLMEKSLNAMLKSLDPYTVYTPEDKIEDYRINNDENYVGIGAQTRNVEGDHFVTMVYEGYPAHKAGLKIGDKIIAVDQTAVKNKSNDELSKLVKGQENTDVILSVERYGVDTPIDVSIKREKVEVSSVSYQGVVENNTGYVKLDQFTAKAGSYVEKAIKEVLSAGATTLVLDLRGNPGGYLHEAVNISNLFIPKGKKVVDTKGRNPIYAKTYNTLNEPLNLNIPLAVLINENSASASEIVSGVVQDYDRGVLVGKKSFGKGLVQKTWKLPYNGQLKATISKYYIPSGRCIQALDYTTKSKDGKASLIADSLKSTFYTNNKRIVFDGGGVTPDSVVSTQNKRTRFVNHLIDKGMVLKYVNKHHFEHKNDTVAIDFKLKNATYSAFKNWLKAEDFMYNPYATVLVDTLASKLKEKNPEIADRVGLLSKEMHNKLDQFLDRDQELITQEIEQEIIRRYYLQEGNVRYSLKHDPQLDAAVAILHDQEKYEVMLRN